MLKTKLPRNPQKMWCVTLCNGVNYITFNIIFGQMCQLVGLILTVPNGPVGPENRGVAGFTHLDTIPLSDESDPSWLEPELELKNV